MSADTKTSAILRGITDRILAALREGRLPWRRPWRKLGMPVRSAGLPFNGANSLILSQAADDMGYRSPCWLTEHQGRLHGARIREGERGTRVLHPCFVPRSIAPDTDLLGMNVRAMRSDKFFNADQFDRLPPRFRPRADAGEGIAHEGGNRAADEFFRATGAGIERGADHPAYDRAEDIIRMPAIADFDDPAAYYTALAHEAIRWTGHESRMDREFSDPEYAMEGLVAELGAGFLLDRLSLPARADSVDAGHLAGWIAILERNERAIYAAATHAQRAADYLVIATGSASVEELAARRLDDRTWIVVYLDIVEVGSHPLVGAVGVDGRGRRRVLGLGLAGIGADRQERAARSLLGDLVARGLALDRRRLFVTGGSALLRRAVDDVFGGEAFVQACRVRCKRDVLAQLPWRESRNRAKRRMERAWRRGADGGPGAMARLADELQWAGGDVAARLLQECLDDLFTVDRFRLSPTLSRALTTTHVIARAGVGLPRQVCRVADWPDPQVALRWAAASFLATEPSYQKLSGHRNLQFLKDELAQMEMF